MISLEPTRLRGCMLILIVNHSIRREPAGLQLGQRFCGAARPSVLPANQADFQEKGQVNEGPTNVCSRQHEFIELQLYCRTNKWQQLQRGSWLAQLKVQKDSRIPWGSAACMNNTQLSSLWIRLPVTHRPAASIRSHVAVDLEACGVMHWKHRVYAVLSMTACVQIATVTGAWAFGGTRE